MFSDKQLQVLKCEIEPSRIKRRDKGSISLSYLEGFDVMETANKIFGFGNWSYTISSLEQVSQETNTNQNLILCYKAIIRLTVYGLDFNKQVTKEDVGFGTGISKMLAEAHEGGAKEAVTDGLKRAMRSFGNQFGNSLYDKSRNHQKQQPTAISQHPQSQQTQDTTQALQNKSQYEFTSLYNLGLQVIDQGQHYIIAGEDIFNKKDSIKACGFRWDASHKVWYLSKEQQAA